MAPSITAFPRLAVSRLTDKRVLNNVRWTLAGNSIYAASQWAIIVVLARWTNAHTVGTFALALALTAPVVILFNMQLRAVVATDVAGSYILREYFQTRLITTLGALTLLLPCAFLLHGQTGTISVVIVVALSKGAESLTDVIHGYWQLIEHMEVVGKSLTLRAFLSLAAFTVAIVATRSLIWGSTALLAGSLAALLMYDLRQVKRMRSAASPQPGTISTFFDLRGIRRRTPATLIRRAFPLGVAAMIISFNAVIPRYFIGLYSGKQQLGIYSALSYFIVVGNLLMNAVGQSVLPRLAKLYTMGNRTHFLQMLAGLLSCSIAVAAASMIVAVFFGRRLLLVYGQEYANAYGVFLTLMGAGSIGYSLVIVNFCLNAVGAYSIQMPLFLSVTLVLLALCWYAVPAHGIAGAAAALLISTGLQGLLSGTVLAVWAFRVPRLS